MPNRLIHESCRQSATLAQLSDRAERLFWRLTTLADDFGRFNATAGVIHGLCYAAMLDKITDKQVQAALDEMAGANLIEVYSVQGRRIARFKTWSRYQQQRAKKPKFPGPEHADHDPEHPISSDIKCDPMISNVSGPDRTRISDTFSNTNTNTNTTEKPDEDDPNSPTTAEELMEGWNDVCVPHGLSAVRDLSASRRKQIGLRLKEHPLTDFWQEVINHICGSPFLLGTNDRGWKVNFDWLFENDTNALKVYEGRYDKEKIHSRNGIGRTA